MKDTFLTLPAGSAPDRRQPHALLVGLPGAGKSTAGEAAAALLSCPFLDFDREIERREGATIGHIVAERGEAYFRGRERELTEELVGSAGFILAPGSGWIANEGVVALLRPPGRIIYLRIRPETALQRLGAQQLSRPLLARGDPQAELRRLLDARAALYERADVVLDAEGIDVQQLAIKIAELASDFRDW